MTPRKELFLAVKDKLTAITGIEYVDLHRKQFGPGNENYTQYYTGCLIKILPIQWSTMVEQRQEAAATIEIKLYTRDGFADHISGTMGNSDGLAEIDLIDRIAAQLQFLKGDTFKALQQLAEENVVEDEEAGVMGISIDKLTFSTVFYQVTTSKYTPQKITIE
ncbi:hypothetical protein G7074_15705 [Pedobacter sp. HDW13]|uniref:hypothetical protein n=1 Tax=Pedobacter sp. HDW13 TaxID=2714940 RepID=UPI00140BBEE4|nr:hypothetical protein [Pedobacter sp. HDW13]QIL40583.1 hypothetical protein G7074_15705 [Pedobacter sp. HDW13]